MFNDGENEYECSYEHFWLKPKITLSLSLSLVYNISIYIQKLNINYLCTYFIENLPFINMNINQINLYIPGITCIQTQLYVTLKWHYLYQLTKCFVEQCF